MKEAEPLQLVDLGDNHVYLWGDVEADSCLTLMKELRQIDSHLVSQQIARGIDKVYPHIPIWLHIQSYGGDLFAALGLANQLQTLSSPIYSIVEGICASAGTLPALVCSRRFILPDSYMLIHQFRTMVYGTHMEFQDEMVMQEALFETMVKFYATWTKLNMKKARKALKHEFWMTAEQAVEKGFADQVMYAGVFE